MQGADRRREDRAWRDQLADIVATLPAGILVHNHDGTIAYANLEAARILGHTQAQLIGRSFRKKRWKVTAPDGTPLTVDERVVSRVLRTGETIHNFESSIERPDGTRAFISINGAPFANSNGNVMAVITSFTDITERTKIEQDHENLRTLLGAVIDEMPVGILVAEAPSGRFLMGNKKLEEMWPPSFNMDLPMSAKGDCLAYHPDGEPYAAKECPLTRTLQKGETVAGEEIHLRCKDGPITSVIVNSAPVHDPRGRTIAAVAIFSPN